MSRDVDLRPAIECHCLAARRTARSITRLYEEKLRSHGLRATQFSILAALALKGATGMRELAELLGLDRTTLTRSAGVLARNGWVEDAPTDDARERPLGLTAEGRLKVDSAFPSWREAQEMVDRGEWAPPGFPGRGVGTGPHPDEPESGERTMATESKVKPVPDEYHTITPYLTVRGAAEALAFYERAFGAKEHFRMDAPGGKLMHAEMRLGDSAFMLTDEFEEWGNRSPATIGATGSSLMVYVEDVDATFQQAVEAGAKVVMPVENHFYGDRMGMVEDPFGHRWSLASHVEDVPPDELERRAREMMGG
jgi:PhnB protein